MTESATTKATTGDSTTSPPQPGKVNTIHIDKPLGHTSIAAMICGVVGGVVALLLDLLQRFDGLRVGLLEYYKSEPIMMSDPFTWSPIWDWLGSVLLAIAVAYVVLDTVDRWRRILFGLIVIILLLSFSPLLMLWDVFWLPVVPVVAVVWSWLCAYFYASQHVMPCELGISLKVMRKKNKTDNLGRQSITLTPATKTAKAGRKAERKVRFSKLKKLVKRKPIPVVSSTAVPTQPDQSDQSAITNPTDQSKDV